MVNSLYCPTGASWDRVVLQLFDASVISSAEVVMVFLGWENIRSGGKRLPMPERIAERVVFTAVSGVKSDYEMAVSLNEACTSQQVDLCS